MAGPSCLVGRQDRAGLDGLWYGTYERCEVQATHALDGRYMCCESKAVDRCGACDGDDSCDARVYFTVALDETHPEYSMIANEMTDVATVLTHVRPLIVAGLPEAYDASGMVAITAVERSKGDRDQSFSYFDVRPLLPLCQRFLRLPRAARQHTCAVWHGCLLLCPPLLMAFGLQRCPASPPPILPPFATARCCLEKRLFG